jgi:putative peptidoglycan lipid II flippase
VKRLLLRAAPVAVGAGIYQINLLVDTIIASWLPTGAISYLFYADRVTQLPLGVVGVAVSTALLPLLVRQVRGNQLSLALHSQNRAVELAFLLTLPAAAALFILAMPIISVLFERGAFGAKETEATAAALAVYATGLPAYVLAKVLTPGFFAREDTVTPVKIALICAILNFILNLLLMGPFLHVGIAIATSVSSWINAALLALVLWRRGQIAPDARLKSRLPRTAMATVAMGLVLALLLGPTRSWLTEETLERTVALGFLIGAGGFTFTAFAYWGGAASPRDLKGLVRGRDVA